VLRAVLSAVPIDEVNTMGVPPEDPYARHGDPSVWAEYRAILSEAKMAVELKPIEKWKFYEAVNEPDHALTIQTGDQALWANVLLTIGCRLPSGG
jgi:L-fucose mutarotase